jgi:23S rRNA pseudouridine1911/1915/1917 synthase
MDDPRLGLVHRIDKETSGLLVVAKNEEARTNLALQFFHKTTRRRYTAVVWGHVDADEGRIEGNIGRNPKDRLQMTVFPDGDQGKMAVTHYRVLERLGYVTVVECRLETGRTHQIRVHMKWIGHTLFNDSRYGGNAILKGTTFAQYTPCTPAPWVSATRGRGRRWTSTRRCPRIWCSSSRSGATTSLRANNFARPE